MIKNKKFDPQEIYRELIDDLHGKNIKHEGHEFDSGARMLDVWYNDSFYVWQFEEEMVGFS
jgi:hypothetical protein